jgi:hypothetical protein
MCMINTVAWAFQRHIGIVMPVQGVCAVAPVGGEDGGYHHVRGGDEPN